MIHKLSESTRFLLLAASLIITCAIITLGFLIFKDAHRYSTVVVNQLNHMQQDMTQYDVMKYDGLQVQGSDVINFIKKHMSQGNVSSTTGFQITVVTESKSTTHTDDSKEVYLNDFTSMYYIKPTNAFIAKVVKNKNGVIIEVLFTKI